MVGAFLAFGTHASLAILAVLSYRLISFGANAPRRSGIPPTPSHRRYLEKRHKRTQACNQVGASHLTRRGDAFSG
jgi:hypothetical protein